MTFISLYFCGHIWLLCKNKFQIRILHYNIMLRAKFHWDRVIFIFCPFGGFPFWDWILSLLNPLWPPKYQNSEKRISDSDFTTQNCARYQVSSKLVDFHFLAFLVSNSNLSRCQVHRKIQYSKEQGKQGCKQDFPVVITHTANFSVCASDCFVQ